MPGLFDPLLINKLEMPNRFVRSATMDSMAENGLVSDAELKLYEDLGKGEIGLIISHGLYPAQEGKASPGQLSAHDDDSIPSLTRLVNKVHENGGRIAAQILHGGWLCSPEVTGLAPVGPSAITNPQSGVQVRELSGDEVYELVDSYVQASRRIIESGFDGVQLHAAHGWILSMFLSPVTNKRNDEWGGTAEKRANLVKKICEGIRNIAGKDFPVMVKLGIKDYHPEGKAIEDGILQAKILEDAGVDSIEVSEGIEEDFFHHIRADVTSPYYQEEGRQTKQSLSKPVMLVGGMRKLKDMQEVIESGTADAISMCRPYIMDPYLVKHIRDGSIDGSHCTSCNRCMMEMRKGSLRCVLV
ncbi:MAG: NADH:flavin oxidoreductase [Dehalococcoidales bacterium]|nr:NADH:flavin oxidoreductase [Dehalococcoidales bacterium]